MSFADEDFEQDGQEGADEGGGQDQRSSPNNPSHNNRSNKPRIVRAPFQGGEERGSFTPFDKQTTNAAKKEAKKRIEHAAEKRALKQEGKQLLKQGIKQAGKQVIKRGIQAAAVAGAAPSAGTSLLIGAAVEALDQAQQFIRDPEKTAKKWVRWMLYAIVLFFILFTLILMVIMTIITGVTGASDQCKNTQDDPNAPSASPGCEPNNEPNKDKEDPGTAPNPNANDCGKAEYKKYMDMLPGDKKGKNYGDPDCSFTKDKLMEFLTQKDAANAKTWFCLADPESGYNPNAFLAASTSGEGAYGLYQMNPPGKGKNQYDNGYVAWKTQVENAIKLREGNGNWSYWDPRSRSRCGI